MAGIYASCVQIPGDRYAHIGFIDGESLPCGFGPVAHAECQFSPVSFFPDRNDHVTVQVATDAKSFCAMKFREGPGYRFTSAFFAKAPPHGVLAKTGPTAFLYRAFDDYRGHDSYTIEICADIGSKHGCSTLIYDVDVK